MRIEIALFVLASMVAVDVRAQVNLFDWTFENSCGEGELTDTTLLVEGCDDGGHLVGTYYRTHVPYPGTLFTRVDYSNHDQQFGVDWLAWELDGVPDRFDHVNRLLVASFALELDTDTQVGLGVISLDGILGPAKVLHHDMQYFPEGDVQRVEYAQAGADFGGAVVSLGDVNDDGVPDYAVGAPLDADATGRVQLLSGADGQLLLDLTGTAPGDRFGAALDALGDVNGDGTPDLIVGSPDESTAGLFAGAARVLSGADGAELALLTGDAVNDRLGSSVAGLGDTDGDGVPDFAVGSPLNDLAGNKAGLVRVHSGVDASVLLQLTGDAARDELGTLVARVGDADGDGLADLLLGTPGADGDGVDRGQVRLVSVASGATLGSWYGEADAEGLGASIAGPGDIDGDGLADVLFSSPDAEVDQARVHSGADGALLHAWDLVDWADRTARLGDLMVKDGTFFARRVAAAGDVDDDGVPDLLVRGTQRDYIDQSVFSPGAHVFLYAFSGRDGSLIEAVVGERGDPRFAESFASAGDLDGDGRDDVLVGHPGDGVTLDAVVTHTSRTVWADLGFALAGAQGEPRLTGSGLLAPDTAVRLTLENAAPSTTSFVVLGLEAVQLPFAGGVLVPAFVPPLGLVKPVPTDVDGGFALQSTWPAGVPSGTSVWLQAWTADGAAPLGRSASNAVRATLP